MFIWKLLKVYLVYRLLVLIFDLNFVFNLVYFLVCFVFVNNLGLDFS